MVSLNLGDGGSDSSAMMNSQEFELDNGLKMGLHKLRGDAPGIRGLSGGLWVPPRGSMERGGPKPFSRFNDIRLRI